ncbi:hypothetical protein [Spirochaeta cellobiosiphila]|uniref:hypothetical protein n=1 Tax=Spirochaeta cellobiosiphila TaxID=504483 RepID=UPI0012ECAE72|nr:hypothetical protein [Spirochaeta cellobiosiphila]
MGLREDLMMIPFFNQAFALERLMFMISSEFAGTYVLNKGSSILNSIDDIVAGKEAVEEGVALNPAEILLVKIL